MTAIRLVITGRSVMVGAIGFSRGVGGAVISPVVCPLEGVGGAVVSPVASPPEGAVVGVTSPEGVGGAVISPVGLPVDGVGAAVISPVGLPVDGVGGAGISCVGLLEGKGGRRRPSVEGVGGAVTSPVGLPAGLGIASICSVGLRGPPESLPFSGISKTSSEISARAKERCAFRNRARLYRRPACVRPGARP
jgi:hypothetical protein